MRTLKFIELLLKTYLNTYDHMQAYFGVETISKDGSYLDVTFYPSGTGAYYCVEDVTRVVGELGSYFIRIDGKNLVMTISPNYPFKN